MSPLFLYHKAGNAASMTIKRFSPISLGLSVIFTLFAPLLLHANYEVSQTDADNRAKALIHATTPSDSINILLDVYNLSDKKQQAPVRGQIIALAQRTDNKEVLGQLINELVTTTDDTGDLARLIEISEGIPEDNDRKTATTVLNMEQAKVEAENNKDLNIQDEILALKKSSLNVGLDPYQEIQNIYRALVYLGTNSQGPMYLDYIMRLGDLVKKLPEKDHAIKNLYYTTAAIYYTRKRDYKLAIETDRELIKQLDIMKQHAEKAGRQIPDLDYFYYVSYRRMLRNFRGLTPQEIKDAYQKCKQLAASNERIQEEFGEGNLVNSYYYVGTGQFAKAIPEINKALAKPGISDFRKMELNGILAWSYRETGDSKNELDALRKFTYMYIDDMRERRAATFKELELRNNVNKIIAQENMEAEKQREENIAMRKTAVTLVYALAIILIFLCGAYFRLRQKVKILESGNHRLRTNIEQIIDNGMPSGTLDLRIKKHRLKG